MLEDLADRWGLPVRATMGGIAVELSPTTFCAFTFPLLIGRGVLAALRFDGIEPPVIRDRIRDETDTQWIMLAAATSQLSPADLTALVVANTIHVDSGTLEIPPPGDRRWVHEPRADRPLPSRTAVAAAIAEMTPPPTDHQAK